MIGTLRIRTHRTCGKGFFLVRRSAFAPTDGDMSEERGRGLKFGELAVGKVGMLEWDPEFVSSRQVSAEKDFQFDSPLEDPAVMV